MEEPIQIANVLILFGVAVVGAVVGSLGTFIAARFNKDKRIISVYSADAVPIVEPTQDIGSALRILFDDKPVNSVYSKEFEIENSGNQSVPLDGLRINLRGSCQILSCRVVEGGVSKDDVNLEISDDNFSVTVTSEFLNKRESIRLFSITSGKPSEVMLDYRRPDVKVHLIQQEKGDRIQLAADIIGTAAIASLSLGALSMEFRKRK